MAKYSDWLDDFVDRHNQEVEALDEQIKAAKEAEDCEEVERLKEAKSEVERNYPDGATLNTMAMRAAFD